MQTRIRDEAGSDVPDGETGELYLKGPNVFAGYWRRDDATRAAFVDGWFKTGDLAQRSADGYYTLCGRRSDLIISGGFNIYPREIEEFLMEQPEVAEAAVVGEPDRVRGEVPVAYIVLRERRLRYRRARSPLPRKLRVVQDSRAGLSWSRSCRATRWARCKSILLGAALAVKILMVASEATPFAKTGGLADVLGSLPPALARAGR